MSVVFVGWEFDTGAGCSVCALEFQKQERTVGRSNRGTHPTPREQLFFARFCANLSNK